MNDIIEQLNWRYATKTFDKTKKLSSKTMMELVESCRLAPSSYGLQPVKLVVISDEETRKALKQHSWNQSQITDASHLIVLCTKAKIDKEYIDNYVEHIALTREIKKEALADYHNMMLAGLPGMQGDAGNTWKTHQVYLTLGVLLTACAVAKIDSCPMEGFDRTKYDEILNLPATGINARVLCAVGYRDANDWLGKAKKVRVPLEDFVQVL